MPVPGGFVDPFERAGPKAGAETEASDEANLASGASEQKDEEPARQLPSQKSLPKLFAGFDPTNVKLKPQRSQTDLSTNDKEVNDAANGSSSTTALPILKRTVSAKAPTQTPPTQQPVVDFRSVLKSKQNSSANLEKTPSNSSLQKSPSNTSLPTTPTSTPSTASTSPAIPTPTPITAPVPTPTRATASTSAPATVASDPSVVVPYEQLKNRASVEGLDSQKLEVITTFSL